MDVEYYYKLADGDAGEALIESIKFKDLEAFIALLSVQEDINITDNGNFSLGWTPLMYAVHEESMEMVKMLVEAGADVSFNATPESNPLISAIEIDSMEIVDILLQAGADVNGNGCLDNPLIEAIIRHRLNYVIKLIKAGADINRPDVSGYTPLMAAVFCGNLELTKILIEIGADIDYYDRDGYSALWLAAYNGYQEIVEYLLQFTTCEEERRQAFEELPYGIIRKQRREDKITSSFICAAAIGDIQTVKQAIKAGVNINAFGESGETALHKASSNGRVEVVRLLSRSGANVEIRSESRCGLGETPLENAVRSRSPDTVEILLESGANPNSKVDGGLTLLMLAVDYNSLAIAKILLNTGVDINARTDRGDTALEIARRCKYQQIVQFLKQAGAVGNSRIDPDSDEI